MKHTPDSICTCILGSIHLRSVTRECWISIATQSKASILGHHAFSDISVAPVYEYRGYLWQLNDRSKVSMIRLLTEEHWQYT